ncbi:MAG TPA: M20/M25/M40 family metallo-hydrolase [Pyrinomonadaceae bacterium]|nr:M20/M25/M40 family metallo-hydrolase [Pyrinomonadaceae bacterium]
MRRFLSALVLTSLLVVYFPASYAQRPSDKSKKPVSVTATSQRGTDTIAAAQLRDYLTFIASDEMEGRDTPSRGLDTTAKFLALNLARWGFKPAGDNGAFFQRIDLRRDRIDPNQTRVELNGRVLTAGRDYLPAGGSGDIKGQLVFAGTGWYLKSKNIDAYNGVDPTGKIAVIFGSPNIPPRGITRADFGKQGENFLNPNDYARKRGAVGIVYVPDFQYIANWERNRQRIMERGSIAVAKFQTPTTTPLPSIVISPEIANGLFTGETQSASGIFNASYGPDMPAPFLLRSTKSMNINILSSFETVPTQNVVAIWEGSDPVLKEEYVALGAHYDHVGICAPGTTDAICNGADDDGSGTTALLSMAEALAKAPTKPKRSVLFVWHCGEEKGLWGSRYFTEYPTVPLDRVVTQINIDMIGRSKGADDTNERDRELTGPNEIYLIGSTMMSSELGELVDTVNKSYLNITYDRRYDDPADTNRFFYRSDHFNYARKGIPIIFFFDGVHQDYHRPGDSADKIDYQKMEKVTRTVYMTLWEVANRPTRPRVDKPLPSQLSGS